LTGKATIFIPDISGYTNFVNRVELDHSSHILAELLEVIVSSEKLGLTLSEVEGDAVLFYAPGEPLDAKALLEQCEAMFRAFHHQLKVIERDSICPCGACQGASGLTLKFVVHFGLLKEIAVANFRKAAGIDMIVAHRLLKNSVPSSEYVLVSDAYRVAAEASGSLPNFNWQTGREAFEGVGEVAYSFAKLDQLRETVPEAEPRQTHVITTGDNELNIDIAASVPDVYQAIIDVDNASNWMAGMDRMERDPVTERVGMRHDCFFPDATFEITYEYGECGDDRAVLADRVYLPEFDLHCRDSFTLSRRDDGSTHLVYAISYDDPTAVPPELVAAVNASLQHSLDLLKQNCETTVGKSKS